MAEPGVKSAGHESRDINVRGVAYFAAGLVAAGILIHFVTAGLFSSFGKRDRSPEAASRIEFHPHSSAPAPRLQVDPVAELDRSQAVEETKLNSYGWVDKPHGIIRIPIERAMDLIAQRGLPARGSGLSDSSGKTPEDMRREKAAATAPK